MLLAETFVLRMASRNSLEETIEISDDDDGVIELNEVIEIGDDDDDSLNDKK